MADPDDFNPHREMAPGPVRGRCTGGSWRPLETADSFASGMAMPSYRLNTLHRVHWTMGECVA